MAGGRFSCRADISSLGSGREPWLGHLCTCLESMGLAEAYPPYFDFGFLFG